MRNSECGIKHEMFSTSLGWAGVAVTGSGICKIVLPKEDKNAVEKELASAERGTRNAERSSGNKLLSNAVSLLTRYFSGEQVAFDVPLDIAYYTPFQRAVWDAALAIPYGETRSYGWIAKKIKKPQAARAVGSALGRNPIPVIIPCHRVITSQRTLGGFSGGLEMKEKLLELEKGCPKGQVAK